MPCRRSRTLFIPFLFLTLAPACGGQVTVRGTVVRAGDTGLPGARVEAVLLASNYRTQAALLERRDAFSAPAARATTDADGRFALELPGGVWQVRARAPGFVAMLYPILPLANPVELPPVTLLAAAQAPVTVADAAGRPLEGAGVYAESADAEVWEPAKASGWRPAVRVGWSDARGRLRLARARGERLNLWVHLPGRVETTYVAGVRRADVTLETAAGVPHVLRVREPDGRPHAGAAVAFARQIWPLGRAGGEGLVTVYGRLAEPLALRVFGTDSRLRNVTVEPPHGGGGAAVTATLARVVPVAGRVVDPRGRPVAGAVVWPGHSPGDWTGSDAVGRFELEVPMRERVRVQAHAAEFLPGSVIFKADPDAPPAITVELAPADAAAGRVVDEAGRPLAGVRLTAIARAPQNRPRAVRVDAADARTVSDAEGRFELRGLSPETAYDVRAARPGFAGAATGLAAGRRRQVPEITLRRGRTAYGAVVDAADRPIAGVEVRVEAADPPAAPGPDRPADEDGAADPFTGVSGADGRFELKRLPASKVDLTARGDGFAPARVRGLRVPPGHGPADLGTLVLLPGVPLRGRVVDVEESPVADAEIRMVEDSPHAPRLWRSREAEGEPLAVSGPRGRFELADLEPQKPFGLLVAAPGYLRASLHGVTAPTEAPLEVVLRPAARVSGAVVDEAGSPVPGARIELTTVTPAEGAPAPEALPRRSAASDGEGRFLIEEVEPGTVEIEAVAPGFQPSELRRFAVAAKEHADGVRFVLAEGAVLEGRVTLADFEPAAGVRVRVGRSSASSDADGRYRVTGIPPGLAAVEVRHPGHGALAEEIEIGPGVNEADFVLEGGRRVAGRAVDASGLPLDGVDLRLEPLEGAPFADRSARSDEDGTFRFEPVADGRYRLHAEHRGYVETTVGIEVARAPVDGLEVLLRTGAVVEGRILGLAFEELARVSVRARAEERAMRTGEVDYEGRYRIEGLAADDWTVEASVGGGRRQARARVSLEPGVPALTRDLEFGGFALDGRVLYLDEPQPETSVTLHGYDFPVRRAVRTDFEGRFRIEDLRAGRYWLDLANHRRQLVHKEDLTLRGDREVAIEIVAARVSGRVSDRGTGRPLGDANVFLRQQSENGRPGTVYGGPSDAGGEFSFDNLEAGRYRLEVVREGYQKAERTLRVPPGGDVGGLAVELRAAEGLEVAAALASGERPRYVTLSGVDEEGRRFAATRMADSTGLARFANLGAGRWRLLVGGTGGALVERRLTVPGEPLAVILPDAGRLRVRVPELVESDAVATLTLTAPDGRRFRQLEWGGELLEEWTVSGGRATVEGVPAGAWTVRVAGPDGRVWAGSAVTTGGPDVEVRLE